MVRVSAERLASASANDATAGDRLRLSVDSPGSAEEVDIEHVSFERPGGEEGEAVCVSGESLAACRATEGDNRLTMTLPAGTIAAGWTGKIVTSDRRQRRCATFFTVPAVESPSRPRLAQNQSTHF